MKTYFQLNFTFLKQGGLVLDCIDIIRTWDNSLMQTPSSKPSFNSTYQCQYKQIRPVAAMWHINNDNDCSVIIKEFIKTLLRWRIKNEKQCGSGAYREYGFCADVRHLYVCEEWQIKISLDTSLFIIFLSLNIFFQAIK